MVEQTELTPWSEFFQINLIDYVPVQERLFHWILSYTPLNGSILEVGFGSGWTSILLAQRGYSVVGIDREEPQWFSAVERAHMMGVSAQFKILDLLSLGFDVEFPSFDTGFSDGVFEHFTDAQVIRGLQIMKGFCKAVIMDVPSWRYRQAPIQRGDEIYRTNRQWKRLIRNAGFAVKQCYGSVLHCPRWYRGGMPPVLAKRWAQYFTTKVGFIL